MSLECLLLQEGLVPFNIGVAVRGDITLGVWFGHRNLGQRLHSRAAFSFAFHTAFVESGADRVQLPMLDISNKVGLLAYPAAQGRHAGGRSPSLVAAQHRLYTRGFFVNFATLHHAIRSLTLCVESLQPLLFIADKQSLEVWRPASGTGSCSSVA